jgi:hypothetical protein
MQLGKINLRSILHTSEMMGMACPSRTLVHVMTQVRAHGLAGQESGWGSNVMAVVSLMVTIQFAVHKARQQTNLLHISCASFTKQTCRRLLLCPKQWNADYEFMPSPITTRCNNIEYHNMNLTATKI